MLHSILLGRSDAMPVDLQLLAFEYDGQLVWEVVQFLGSFVVSSNGFVGMNPYLVLADMSWAAPIPSWGSASIIKGVSVYLVKHSS